LLKSSAGSSSSLSRKGEGFPPPRCGASGSTVLGTVHPAGGEA